MAAASDGGTNTGVGSQLATLVPSFDPSTDSMLEYQQKVELVLMAWPKNRITELTTRLILNCKGSAFSKLQLHQVELMENDEKAVKRLIELLGGHWGRIALEKQYEEAEIALYHLAQMQDESNDSYLARADVAWSKLQSRKLSLDDLQAYILLRGSGLNAEDKKRVILESDNSLEGKLTVKRVSEAVRLLGATFFHDMTGARKTAKTKVYGTTTLMAEDEDHEGAFAHMDDQGEDEYVDCLVNEGDEDATLVADFEAAAVELLQDDPELSSAFSAYTEARRRLSEKFKNRGFWSTSSRSASQTSKGKSGSSKGFGKGKNNWSQKPRRSLQDRILNSYCRNCNRKGHWKAECPFRQSGQGSSTATGGSTGSSSLPATTVSIDQSYQDVLPLEFLHLPEVSHGTLDDALPILVNTVNVAASQGTRKSSYHSAIQGESYGDNGITLVSSTPRERLKAWGFRNESREPARMRLAATLNRQRTMSHEHQQCAHAKSPLTVSSHHRPDNPITDVQDATICFATHGSHGILDLGASKTVIGSDHVAELIQSLDSAARKKLSRCPCNITFRFGNQGTLNSHQALVIPIGPLLLKVAIVPGGTPFLISNTLMRAIEAKIDCASKTLSSHLLSSPVPLQLTAKGLFLIDVNQLIKQSQSSQVAGDPKRSKTFAETFVSDETKEKPKETKPPSSTITQPIIKPPPNQEDESQIANLSQPSNMSQEQKLKNDATEPCFPDSRAQTTSIDPVVESPKSAPQHGIPLQSSSCVADSSNDDSGEPGALAFRRPGRRDHIVWPEAPGTFLSGSMGRSRMGSIHDQQVRGIDKGEPPPILEVCGAQDRAAGTGPECGATTSAPEQTESSKGSGKAHGKEPGHSHLFAGCDRRLGRGIRDVHPSDYDLCPGSDVGRGACSPNPNVEHGECPDQSDSAHRRAGRADHEQPGPRGQLRDASSPIRSSEVPANMSDVEQSIKEITNDWNESIFTTVHSETVAFWKQVEEITAEFQEILHQTKPMGSPWAVSEVMCSSNSPITQQVLRSGHSAFRFGLEQGDLATSTGRSDLFRLIARHRPKHLWYSPTCGPWSSWSQLNASRSMYHQDHYRQLRKDLQYQIALGIVLYRHQHINGNHFHWEQPQKSLMFQNPNLNEIHEHTQACQFDMCRAGDLVDPESQLPMRKGMTILTTFEPFFRRFHGLTCDHRHQHQPIEGSCVVPKVGRVLRSQYTEVYPRKFARAVAQVLSKGAPCRPYGQ